MFFTKPQISLVNKSFETAEMLVKTHFRLDDKELRAGRYDVKTLAELEKDEVNKNAFAHICRYRCEDSKGREDLKNYTFYRICLQDDRILDAVSRGKNFIKLYPLLLYIATHELVHIIRFGRGESNFDANLDEKAQEEKRVHAITHNMLKSRDKENLGLVLDCFSNQYILYDA
jgi:hypothetical protein